MAQLAPYYVHSRYSNWRQQNIDINYSDIRNKITELQKIVDRKVAFAKVR